MVSNKKGPTSLETTNLFIDTSIFIGQNYAYEGPVFKNFIRLSKTGRADLFLTPITIKEIESHIESDVSKAVGKTSKFKKNVKVFRNIDESPFNELFQKIDRTDTTDKLIKQLNDFISDVNPKIVSTLDVSVDVVFDKYFDRNPPFGEGKKKSEFPDAFVLEALEDWCNDNSEKMYIVSADKDMRSFCKLSDSLISLEKLADFINLVEDQDETLAPAIHELIEKNKEDIEESISEEFLIQGFWIEEQDGEADNIQVNSQEIFDINLLEVNSTSAVIEIAINTNFSADLTYDDLDTAWWDSEDKVLIPWDTIEKTVEQDVEYTATVYISHKAGEHEDITIDRVSIHAGKYNGFSINSDDEWPYK